MCFIELLKRVATITIHRLTQLFTLDCVSCIFLGMIWRGCRGGRKLPRRVGYVSNGSDKATYDGPEGVNQSDTVSIPVVAPGQSIQGSHRRSTLKFPDFSLTKYDFP